MARYLTELADVLADAGLRVHELDGWRTRGNRASYGGPMMDRVRGGLVHHTGTPADSPGDLPTRRYLRDGATELGADKPGPLCQLAVGRGGSWWVVAAGLAYHAGAVDDQRYANLRCIGVALEHPGQPTTVDRDQYRSLVRGCAALANHYGIRWRGHKEAAVPYGRKVDPAFAMGAFRAAVGMQRRQLARGPRERPPRNPDPDRAQSSPYTVRPGDTLTAIARRAQTSVKALLVLNGLSDPDAIRAGQRLYTRWHVSREDTLTRIAELTGASVRELARLNGLRDPDALDVGMQLRVPL
jgi:LysM repeat protein